MANQHSWKKRLEPFGAMVYEMHAAIRRDLSTMADAELIQLSEDSLRVTDTNIGWGTHHAAPIIRDEIRDILRERAAAREHTDEGASDGN